MNKLLLFGALLCSIPLAQADAQITPNVKLDNAKIYWGDIVYLQSTLRNDGEEAVSTYADFSRSIGNLALQVKRLGSEKTCKLPPPSCALTILYKRDLPAGENILVGVEEFCLPPAKSRNSTFWSETRQGDSLTILAWLDIPGGDADRSVECEVEMLPRNPAEQQWLEDLYSAADAWDQNPVGQFVPEQRGLFAPIRDLNRPIATDRRVIDELIDHEERLSPGTLRNVAHLLGLLKMIASPDRIAEEARMAAVDEVFEFLDDLNSIERDVLTRQTRNFLPMGLTFSTPATPDAPAEALRSEMRRRLSSEE